ncbi:MAG: peptidase [Verrucomicrobiota bacterium]
MFQSIFLFELRYHLRRPAFVLISLIFFVLALTDVLANAKSGDAFFFVNSPSQIFETTILYTVFSALAATAFIAETFIRDSRFQTDALILATPLAKWHYLLTRFLAAFIVTLISFSFYLPGMILGTLFPGLNPFALGPLRLEAYFIAYLQLVIPNLLIVSALVFCLASLTRSLAVSYAGAIVLMMLYLGSLMMTGIDLIDFENYYIWALSDPFGLYAVLEKAFTWTIHERNTVIPTFSTNLFWNRVIWIGFSLIMMALAYARYSMSLEPKRKKAPVVRIASASAVLVNEENKIYPSSEKFREFGLAFQFRQWLKLSIFDSLWVLRSRAFLLISLFGALSMWMTASGTRSFYYSDPSTDLVIHTANIYLESILLIIIVVYAAELVWRDRTLRIHEVIDATPVSNAILMLSKVSALFIIITVSLLFSILVLMFYQTSKGYTNYEVSLYLQMLFVEHGPHFYCVAAAAIFMQVIARHRYLGMALTVGLVLSPIILNTLHLYHNLYRFAQTNDIDYSPMNGYGSLLTGHYWYSFYWLLVSTLLLIVTYLIWPRGTLFNTRIANIISRWKTSNVTFKSLTVAVTLMALTTGGWIYYNTCVLNEFQSLGKDQIAAKIETDFRKYEDLPMPVVTGTKLNIELYPEEEYFIAQGQYELLNETGKPIHEIHLLTFINLYLERFDYPGATLREEHRELGYFIYDLAIPLMPGEKQKAPFTVKTLKRKGFLNQVDADEIYMISPNDVVHNGTNLYSPFILPFIGYTKMAEHKKAWMRHKYGLPSLEERMKAHNDPDGLSKAFMASHLSWGSTDVTISTSDKQIAVTAGKLMRQWEKNGRNYFHYKSQVPVRGIFTICSAEYEIYRDGEPGQIPIELYYHPQHDRNLELIVKHLRGAHDFYASVLGQYPYGSIRLMEFVYYDGMLAYNGGALGLPEALVWKSIAEGLGKENLIKWLSYTLALSWWEDQIISADVAGSMSIRESLAYYMCGLYQRSLRTDQENHEAKQHLMRSFFRQRGRVNFEEPALDNVYNELPIAKYKGGMTLELIEYLIGIENLLSALKEFYENHKFNEAPYATILDLRDIVLAKTSTTYHNQVQQLFHEVITYQLGIEEATCMQKEKDQYITTLKLTAEKQFFKGLGEQKSTSLDLPVKIELKKFSENGVDKVIASKQWVANQKDESIEIITEEKPDFAWIDPDYTFPSVFLQNNQRRVQFIR